MAWDFDSDAVLVKLGDIIETMVGPRLSFLPKPDGTPSIARSVIIDNQSGPQPPLPFITLSYEGSNDDEGFILDTGVIDTDPPNLVFASFWDKFTVFGITIRCEGDDSESILRSIRKQLLLERHRKTLRDDVFSSVQLINTVRRTPDLLSKDYREVGSFLLTMNTIDRLIDTDTGVFDTVEYEQTTKRISDEDPNPIVKTGSVGPVTP